MKIKLEHLAPYLPYQLKVRLPIVNKKSCRKYVIGTVGSIYSDASICCHDTVNSTPDWFKPILRPMSDLFENQADYQDIIDEFSEIGFQRLKDSFLSLKIPSINYLDYINYTAMTKMLKHHFDVFGLINKGLAIYIH